MAQTWLLLVSMFAIVEFCFPVGWVPPHFWLSLFFLPSLVWLSIAFGLLLLHGKRVRVVGFLNFSFFLSYISRVLLLGFSYFVIDLKPQMVWLWQMIHMLGIIMIGFGGSLEVMSCCRNSYEPSNLCRNINRFQLAFAFRKEV